MRPAAYTVTVVTATQTRQIIVFGRAAAQRELRQQQRQNPTAQVTLTSEKESTS